MPEILIYSLIVISIILFLIKKTRFYKKYGFKNDFLINAFIIVIIILLITAKFIKHEYYMAIIPVGLGALALIKYIWDMRNEKE